MRSVVSSAAKCFDWRALALHPPRQAHATALLTLYKALQPSLQFTCWPRGGGFEFVEKAWPSPRGLLTQYKLLLARIRGRVRAQTGTHSSPSKLFEVSEYMVSPAIIWAGLLAVCKSPFLGHKYPLSVVTEFLLRRGVVLTARVSGRLERVRLGQTYQVRAGGLCSLGHGLSHHGARDRQRHKFRGYVGSAASVSTIPHIGRWVRVRQIKHVVVVSEMHAMLDTDPELNREQDGHHCWHACRLAHRCRLLRGPESECERWGSYLHHLWSPVQGLEPWRMSARLMIRECGLAGHGGQFEESVVAELARLFCQNAERSAFRKRRRCSQQPRAQGDGDEDVAGVIEALSAWRGSLSTQTRTGRLSEHFAYSKEDRQTYKPSVLPEACVQQVEEHLFRAQGDRERVIAALPRLVEDKRTAAKSLAPSVLRQTLLNWLDTDDASALRESRKALFGKEQGDNG